MHSFSIIAEPLNLIGSARLAHRVICGDASGLQLSKRVSIPNAGHALLRNLTSRHVGNIGPVRIWTIAPGDAGVMRASLAIGKMQVTRCVISPTTLSLQLHDCKGASSIGVNRS